MLDTFLRGHAVHEGAQFVAFDLGRDYRDYIDGKQRSDGVRSFLASRGIALPEGCPRDPAGAATVSALGNRKNELVLAMIHERGVQAYGGSVRFVQAVRDAGLRRAVVSASANCREVLEVAGIADLFEVRVDGVVAEREHLRGKPAWTCTLAAARARASRRGGGVEDASRASPRTGGARSASSSASTAPGRRDALSARRRIVAN
jgi:beta-phosphoglucomutase-like phosphatase (HAD superfamily)